MVYSIPCRSVQKQIRTLDIDINYGDERGSVRDRGRDRGDTRRNNRPSKSGVVLNHTKLMKLNYQIEELSKLWYSVCAHPPYM